MQKSPQKGGSNLQILDYYLQLAGKYLDGIRAVTLPATAAAEQTQSTWPFPLAFMVPVNETPVPVSFGSTAEASAVIIPMEVLAPCAYPTDETYFEA